MKDIVITYKVQTFLIDKKMTGFMRAADLACNKVFGSFETIVIRYRQDSADIERVMAVGRKAVEAGEVAFWEIIEVAGENFSRKISKQFRHPDIWELSDGERCGFIKHIEPMAISV